MKNKTARRCVSFKFDLTEMTITIPNLPTEWNNLMILLVSDLHFHGTPSRVYFDRVINQPHDLGSNIHSPTLSGHSVRRRFGSLIAEH